MEKKKVVVDHYRVLGLPSGEEGSKLNKKEITEAYRAKALQLHPDKRPNDPNAKVKFQKLNSSYEILMDPKARKQPLFFLFATDEICLRKDSVHSMLVRVGNFFKHKPPEAANNQESQGDDHEDIEDWVIV
ncbi:uncharacterized protein LOC133731290 [Rosa rugosa]|uniref:uncharacterized protein LOC133731285 n=1 Tax=Rosa rugosa TaxID=74645 RepID=UPI002B413F45|nr:uncharacterized protein LOC133731285 [Rosa rugosa]XP_062014680.1 uncharacterized protein LOC133731287 [Rosa rugosa]XP_062014681.1 uncharacterized protein LOC133731290 [Rosa rugosa]